MTYEVILCILCKLIFCLKGVKKNLYKNEELLGRKKFYSISAYLKFKPNLVNQSMIVEEMAT